MNSDGLTPLQVERLLATVRRHLRYYGQLRARMEQLSFSPTDPLYQAVTEAFNGVHQVHVTAHYLGCAPGTAGRAKFETKEGETPAWIRATERRLD